MSPPLPSLRCARAFTLIELLIVIAIILILAAILLPVLASARAQGRRAACRSNLSQIYKAVQMYTLEHESTYPAVTPRKSLSNLLPSLPEALKHYVESPDVFRCPADRSGFFALEGTSYEWNAILNGRTQDSWIEQVVGPSRTPMLYDFESWHPDQGVWGGKNVAMCDGSVTN